VTPVPSPIATLASRRAVPPATACRRWFSSGGGLDDETRRHAAHPWYLVLWLTGVDYFSTLGYQPGIALLAAGALSPVATALLIAVTLLGALPVYAQVASRSYAGQGSIAMLEHLLSGWWAKGFVLVLLGFAATDYVITITLSAADAAQHALENPYLHPWLGEARVGVTIGLLFLLALVFLRGFVEAIGLAAAVAIPYLVLNVVVLSRGLVEIWRRPELISQWRVDLALHGDWTALLLASAVVFPRLALGMSGFETGVSVMPLVSGGAELDAAVPRGRIAATRKLLTAAALIMSVLLLASSFVTLLIPEQEYRIGGPASGRAIAYLAHGLLGNAFGTAYDFAAIAILWFAGASAMAGLLNLIPRYLPRFGMSPHWVVYRRPLVLVLFAIAVVVTLFFGARVETQAGAYATGVLALILSASVAVALALWRESRSTRPLSVYFWLVSGVLLFTLIDNVIARPDGIIIASCFIAGVLVVSGVSRWRRATELRVAELTSVDELTSSLWPSLVGKKVNLVPIHTMSPEGIARKTAEIRKYSVVRGTLAFVHVRLLDNRSDFLAPLRLRVWKGGDDFLIEITGALAIANTIAYVSEMIDPISIFVGLSRQHPMTQALRYLLWGEGETGLMLYAVLVRYWESTPEEDVRPLIFLLSD
jgi:hypothetical protein